MRVLVAWAVFLALHSVPVLAFLDTPAVVPEELRRNLAGTEGQVRVDLLNELAYEVKSNSPPACLALASEALELAEKLDYEAGRVEAHRNLGLGHYFLAEYDLAMEQYQRGVEIAERIGDRKGVADAANNIGVLFFVWGMYDEALEHYLKALALRRELNDTLGEARAYNNIAGVQQSLKRYDEALESYDRSLELYETLGELPYVASTLNNIGLVLRDTDRPDEALDRFTRALAILGDLDDRSFLALTLNNIGTVHDQRGELDTALDHYQRALAIRIAIGDRQGEVVTRTNLGIVLSKLGRVDEASATVEQALRLARLLNVPEVRRDTELAAAEIAASAGDHRRAFELYRDFKDTSDVILDRDRARAVAEMQTRFEVEGKDREIAMLRRTRELDRQLRTITILVTALLVVIVFLLFNRHRVDSLARRAIEARNRELEETRSELEQALRSQLAHVSRVATLGELAAGFAHELNQPLAAILSNARVSLRLLARPDEENLAEVGEALVDIDEGAERASEIIKRLRELIRRGDVSVEELDVNETIRAVDRLIQAEAGLAHVPVRFDFAADLPRVLADRIQLQQVVLNLVQNGVAAMAGGGADHGELVIGTRFHPDRPEVVVAVSDSGPPLADGVIEQMFDPFFTTKPDGLGMGLRISRTIVEAHQGRLWAIKNPDRGLTVQLSIPAE